MDVVGVMAAHLPVVRLCTALSRDAGASLDSVVHTMSREALSASLDSTEHTSTTGQNVLP